LHVASRHGKEKCVEALISFNANTLLLDKIDRTAESLASGIAQARILMAHTFAKNGGPIGACIAADNMIL